MTDLTRQELDARIEASEAKVDARLANFDASIKAGFAEMRTEIEKLRGEVHKGTSDLLRWGVGIAVAIVGTTVGLLTYINRVSDKPAPVAHPPVVYFVQPGPPPVVLPAPK